MPALIVFSANTTSQRSDAWYRLGLAAASNGLVGIVPDIGETRTADDFDALLAYVAGHASELGVDPNAIAVFAGSGNVSSAFPLVEDPRLTTVRAAVMFYGSAPAREFRLDLPVFYVRAGLDRPDVNRRITELAAAAIAQNAPLTLVNNPSGHHAFEVNDDDDATRASSIRCLRS